MKSDMNHFNFSLSLLFESKYASNNEERFLFNDFYLMLKIQSNIANIM